MLRSLVAAGFVAAAQAGGGLPDQLCFTAQGLSPVASLPTTTVQSTVSFEWSEPDLSSPSTPVTTTTLSTHDEFISAGLQARAVSTGSAYATVTSTKYITITTQRTVFATSVVYKTVTSQPTAVLATPPGFTPLASNANITAAGGVTRKRSSIDQHRTLQNRRAEASSDQLLLNPNAKTSRARFPQSVTCVEYVAEVAAARVAEPNARIVARSAAPATTASTSNTSTRSTKASSSKSTIMTSKATFSSKNTSSSSQSRAVTATITITITKTSTVGVATTTTIFSTSTTTTYLPATTSLSICQPNNFVHSVAGLGIGFIDNPSGTQTNYGSGISAPDCCAACKLSGSCAGFLSWWYDEDFGILFNSPAGVCDATGFHWGFFTDDSGDRPGASVGNGNCGQAIYGGNGDWCENVFSGPCVDDG